MKIGIDGSRAFIKKRTGIEEYSYQTIKYLRQWLKEEEVFLYIRQGQEIDFEIPKNWKIRKLWFPRFWTQIRLSVALMFDPVDSLFVPAHTVPIFHPKKTTVVIHGLEYEFCPQAYSWLERLYMRFVIKNSCKWASRVVCVSENTKRDLISKYAVSGDKISVVYEGYANEKNSLLQGSYSAIENKQIKELFKNSFEYVLFVGRIEKRKNVVNIVKAFEILKSKYPVQHKLVLAGKPGFGYGEVSEAISKSYYRSDIIELGYISDSDKWALLKRAGVFAFPTFYEGFGLPILEAQKMMVPVVTSRKSSIPEVAGEAALYVDPEDYESIAENIYILVSNDSAREDMIRRGLENLKRFSWVDCAKNISSIIKND